MAQYINDNCRICLKTVEERISLNAVPENYNKDYLTLLKEVVSSLEISYEDSLPKQLCDLCANEVLIAYRLRKKAVSSEKILQNLIQKQLENKVQTNDIESLDTNVITTTQSVGTCGNVCEQCTFTGCSLNKQEESGKRDTEDSSTMDGSCRFCGNNLQSCNFCSLDEDKTDINSLEVTSIVGVEPEEGEDEECSGSETIKPDESKYKCSECEKEFVTKSRLKKHIMTHSPSKPFHCKNCKWSFATDAELQTHVLVNHNTEGRNECIFCQKVFKEKRLLRQHYVTHKQQKRFNCKYCDKGFNLLHHLKNHEKIHENKSEYDCDRCHKKFLTKDRLLSHQKTHGEKKFKCKTCEKSFTTNAQLVSHEQTHSTETNFICAECGLQFIDKSKFDHHQKQNCGSRIMTKAICLVCNLAFDTENILKEHMKLHTNALICPTCKKSFLQLNSLQAHIKTHTVRPFVCDNCKESFSRMDHLKYHIARKHSNSDEKEEIYRYSCTECGKRFLQSGELTIHSRIHTNLRPYVCTICQKSFNQSNQLKAHERIHLNEKPYICNICNNAYHSASGLNQHLKSNHTKIVTVEAQISIPNIAVMETAANESSVSMNMSLD